MVSYCHHRLYKTNLASQTGSGISQDGKGQIPLHYWGVSSSNQTHGTLVPDVQLEEGPKMMRVVKPQCIYQLVPTQLSTKGYQLGTDNMQYAMVPTLQFLQFWGGSLG